MVDGKKERRNKCALEKDDNNVFCFYDFYKIDPFYICQNIYMHNPLSVAGNKHILGRLRFSLIAIYGIMLKLQLKLNLTDFTLKEGHFNIFMISG